MNGNAERPRVLVIDDDDRLHFVLCRLLKPLASRVASCRSADEAKEMFEPGRFDVVLCDLHIPGVVGLELVEWLCERDAGVRCVVMTGFASEGDAVGITELGAELLQKPFTAEQLGLAIQ